MKKLDIVNYDVRADFPIVAHQKKRYCETGALDDASVGIGGSGAAAASFVPPPVVPVCPRRPRCEPCGTVGSLAATGCIGGCAMN